MVWKRLRPMQGWRVFAGEVGVIVLGVLIALGAQQLLEEWNWRSQASKALRGLAVENAQNFNYAVEQVVVAPCLDAQLDGLADRLMASGDTWRPVERIESALGAVAYRRPSRPYGDVVWTAAVSDGVSSHISDEQRTVLARTYTQVTILRGLMTQSDQAVDSLTLLLRPEAFDAATRMALVQAINSEKGRARRSKLISLQIMLRIEMLGMEPTAAAIDNAIEKSGTVIHCRARGLPLADWRAGLDKERADTVERGDPVTLAGIRAQRQ